MEVFSEENDPGPLLETDADPDPMQQFRRWFDEARWSGAEQPDAMVLATVGEEGRPSARAVLLRSIDDGFVFYSGYLSRKGRELAANPQAAVCFVWPELRRQVRAEGLVRALSDAQSDLYFLSRPRGAQISASVSPQSEVVPDREHLEQLWVEFENAHPGEIRRPRQWGGYRLTPTVLEFWQGRPNRFHDRLRYRRTGLGWAMERLAP